MKAAGKEGRDNPCVVVYPLPRHRKMSSAADTGVSSGVTLFLEVILSRESDGHL